MKIRSVSVSYGETRSANFQAGRVDVGLTADVTEEEDPDVVRLLLEEKCRKAVNEIFRRKKDDVA